MNGQRDKRTMPGGVGPDYAPTRSPTLCVTGGRGLGLWLISPGGLFCPVEIENN